MTNNLINKIEELDATKWLDYAFRFLTGAQKKEATPEKCINRLRALGYSEELIIRFSTEASYTFDKFGNVVMMLPLKNV